ncbi:MAG: hypothetical protein ACM36C_14285 [Acidobacteriota bacterium]
MFLSLCALLSLLRSEEVEHALAVLELLHIESDVPRRRGGEVAETRGGAESVGLERQLRQLLCAHALAGGAEALEAEHVRAVGADVAPVAVLRFALAAGGTEVTFVTMMAT